MAFLMNKKLEMKTAYHLLVLVLVVVILII